MLFAIVFMMAEVPFVSLPQDGKGDNDSVPADTINRDSALTDTVKSDSAVADTASINQLVADTLLMDSIQKAIWMHNKLIDDSLRADSLNRMRKNGIDAPVKYTAQDSMVYEGEIPPIYLIPNFALSIVDGTDMTYAAYVAAHSAEWTNIMTNLGFYWADASDARPEPDWDNLDWATLTQKAG